LLGLPAGRNGRWETPNTTGSLASRVDRPACGTLDGFVDDVIAFPPIWGNSIAGKVAIVRFCFLVVDFGKLRTVSHSARTPEGRL